MKLRRRRDIARAQLALLGAKPVCKPESAAKDKFPAASPPQGRRKSLPEGTPARSGPGSAGNSREDDGPDGLAETGKTPAASPPQGRRKSLPEGTPAHSGPGPAGNSREVDGPDGPSKA